MEQEGYRWVDGEDQARRVARPEALQALFVLDLQRNVLHAQFGRRRSSGIARRDHSSNLHARHDVLDGRGEELGECAGEHADADLIQRRQPARAQGSPSPLANVRVCQEEEERVAYALDRLGQHAVVKGTYAALFVVYPLHSIANAVVLSVRVGGRELLLHLEARDDDVERVGDELGDGGPNPTRDGVAEGWQCRSCRIVFLLLDGFVVEREGVLPSVSGEARPAPQFRAYELRVVDVRHVIRWAMDPRLEKVHKLDQVAMRKMSLWTSQERGRLCSCRDTYVIGQSASSPQPPSLRGN